MSIAFDPIETDDDRARLAALADEIWHEYWPALIGPEQTDYMVASFQSLEAIERDMREHAYEYWFMRAEDGGRIVGYTGGHAEPETNRFFISKVYLLADERGKGFASKAIAFYERLCRERGFEAMYLTVNKHNDLGIRAYLGKGFQTIDAVETDIGNGFIMDDYIMEKRVDPQPLV
ncbi:GNAT family N-acetyltransferase [Eggerthella sinensis]|uniref:GNAT family N-acetyltransferase n=1 Tax=Eggerthella sinensis TaxID=242230 RepID=A0A3N0J2H7_9ACTN|nr:GNAT family N-acetyltransferase [Eggerthella sinensis]RDB71363.1 GNAT family N-acetyltransferase [Eggerthella sinensis]RNM43431.1 GNAT family N-acetyltransferase [Eggerthella sinensis]